MDLDNFSTGSLIAALTLGSVGVTLVGLALLDAPLTGMLILMIGSVGIFSLFVWQRGTYPWYFVCSWTIPIVAAVALLFNFSAPMGQIRFLGQLFAVAGGLNLLMWRLFRQTESD